MTDWRPSAERKALEARANLLGLVRSFFHARGVLEVETPLLCSAGVTDPAIEPFIVTAAGGPRYLQTSPEYPMKRLLAAGSPGKRVSLPNSRIILHQPLGGFKGQASDIAIQANEILRLRENISQILTNHTKQSIEKIQTDIERDFIMTPDMAKGYGIIDTIIQKRSQEKM